MREVNPLRLFVKAALLFLVINFAFALWNPPIGKLSIYNWLVPGRVRFPYGQGAFDNNLTVDNLDAMFVSHVVSAKPADDEIRVFFVGDSSIWGDFHRSEGTLSEQVNALDLSCNGKKIRVYNLGYPHTFLLKDLLLLHHGMQYDPDLVFWFVTTDSFLRKEPFSVLTANPEEAVHMVSSYGVDYGVKKLAKYQKGFWGQTLFGQREDLARIAKLQLLGFVWDMTGLDRNGAPVDFTPANRVMSDDFAYRGTLPPFDLEERLMVGYLDSGALVARDVPLVVVNEPILIATQGHSDIRYNDFYPRWAYDQYREILQSRAGENQWFYLDLWDSVPESYFMDTPLHLTAEGEAQFAKILQPEILKFACGKE